MPARRLAVVALLALLGGVVPPATAAPALRTLTVRGATGSYAEVAFPTRVRLSTASSSTTPPEFSGSGAYAGVYVTPVTGRGPGAGTLLLRRMFGGIHFALGPSKEWLAPGRYRVHLLGEGATTVRIRVEGLRRDIAVTTRTPSDVTVTTLDRGVVGTATPVDRTILPLPVRRTTLTVVASSHESTGFAGRRNVCVRPRGDGLSPCLDPNGGYGWYYGVYPITWTLGGAGAWYPGELPAGEHEVEFLDVTVGVPHRFHVFAMTLH